MEDRRCSWKMRSDLAEARAFCQTLRMRFACLVALLLLSACSGSTVMDSSRYDRTCTQASDCAAVYSGDVCAACTCPNDAIRSDGLTAWEAEAARARKACGRTPPVACDCQEAMTACESGACKLVPAP